MSLKRGHLTLLLDETRDSGLNVGRERVDPLRKGGQRVVPFRNSLGKLVHRLPELRDLVADLTAAMFQRSELTRERGDPLLQLGDLGAQTCASVLGERLDRGESPLAFGDPGESRAQPGPELIDCSGHVRDPLVKRPFGIGVRLLESRDPLGDGRGRAPQLCHC